MAKRITKADAERDCAADLRKHLGREPTAQELASAVKAYMRGFREADRAIDARKKSR